MTVYAIRILKTIKRLLSHYSQITMLFTGINAPTYSQNEHQIKSKLSTVIDYFYLFFILNVFPVNYHLFQFDCKERKEFKEYMDGPTTPFLKHKLYDCLWDDNYSCLVNDKYIFHCYCRYYNIPVPETYGVLRSGVFTGMKGNLYELMSMNNIEKVILKPLRGMQGKEIHFITRNEALSLLENTVADSKHSVARDLKKHDFIVQENIRQHPELNKINPHSVNTVRIVTLLTRTNEVEFIAAILRTSSTHYFIDNFNSGGIVIGIDLQTGKLMQRGFLKPQYGTTVMKHPLSKTEFYNFQIPYWNKIRQIATKAQKTFHYLKSIGWDFAITSDGPVIIEGNIEWGTAGLQAANGGLLNSKNRALFEEYGLFFYD